MLLDSIVYFDGRRWNGKLLFLDYLEFLWVYNKFFKRFWFFCIEFFFVCFWCGFFVGEMKLEYCYYYIIVYIVIMIFF